METYKIKPEASLLENALHVGIKATNWEKRVAKHIGITNKKMRKISKGKVLITPEVGSKLAMAIGGTAKFWVSLSRNYRMKLCSSNVQSRETML